MSGIHFASLAVKSRESRGIDAMASSRGPYLKATGRAMTAGSTFAKCDSTMHKVMPLLLLLVMALHLVRPIGLPGLKRRSDFWKIAVAAIVAMMLTVLIRP